MRYVRGLKGTKPDCDGLAGIRYGDSRMFFGLDIFSTSNSHASRNSPEPSANELDNSLRTNY